MLNVLVCCRLVVLGILTCCRLVVLDILMCYRLVGLPLDLAKSGMPYLMRGNQLGR
jgi:hypothetical protein